mmetsp:Transcript_7137/g.9316  ORF Transcript_7137/g.9316 Transcript_7137/m.9316 type:complete len:499 (+) Transcript_7137:173-1669(+)
MAATKTLLHSNDSKSLWNYTLSPGWTEEEVEVYRLVLMKVGIGKWSDIINGKYLPGKTANQLNNQLQRMLGQQSTAEFYGLHLDPSEVFLENKPKSGFRKNGGCLINMGDNPTREIVKQKKLLAKSKWGLEPSQYKNIIIPKLSSLNLSRVVLSSRESHCVDRLKKYEQIKSYENQIAYLRHLLEAKKSGRSDEVLKPLQSIENVGAKAIQSSKEERPAAKKRKLSQVSNINRVQGNLGKDNLENHKRRNLKDVEDRHIVSKKEEQKDKQGSCKSSGRHNAEYKVNEAIEARYEGVYYPGLIDKVNGDGTFCVLYDDGGYENEVPASEIRKPNQPSPPLTHDHSNSTSKQATSQVTEKDNSQHQDQARSEATVALNDGKATSTKKKKKQFKVHERIHARFDGVFYPGTIDKLNEDGSYSVLYDDGGYEAKVPENEVKPLKYPPHMFKPGQKIEAMWQNGKDFFPGTIVREQENGMYHIQYDDGDVETHVLPELIATRA